MSADTIAERVEGYGEQLRGAVASYMEDMSERLSPAVEEGLYDFDPDSLSGDEIEELKDERFVYTVEHAWENSPFYRELMEEQGVTPDDFDGLDDIHKLPVVDADDVRQNQPPATDEYRFKNDDAYTRRPFNTSGSTGNPKTLFYSQDEVDRMYDDVRRGFKQLGMEEGDKVVNYFPFVGLNISCFGTEGGMEEMGAETIPVSNTPLPTEAEAGLLASHAPDEDDDTDYTMIGLPSHVDAKGRQLEKEGMDPEAFGVDRIILAGEPVTQSRKDYIADTYDAEVYEFLGSTEAGGSAYECREREGKLHLIEDSIHHEILDEEEHEPVDEGEEGELVVTRLLHPGEESSMPLLRYNLGDLVSYQEEDGDCGCELSGGRLIESPRRDKWSFILGAVNLDPLYFEENIFEHDDLGDTVEEYQLQVEYDEESGQDVLDVILETEAEGIEGTYEDITRVEEPEDELEELGNSILDGHSHLHDTVDTVGAARINIDVVDEIEMGKGKPTRIIDRREQ